MPKLSAIDLGQPARRLRVNTLSRLRWLALTGQAGAVLFTHIALGFPLPLAACLLIIGASASCAGNILLAALLSARRTG